MSATNPAGAPLDGRGGADRADADDRCLDLVAGYDEDGPTAYECGALVRHTETGYSCARGHAYTYAAHREAEGWDYASDPVEAELLGRAGVIGVRPDDGRPWL
ncbi:hypothetical protein OG883_44265 [Streptomyces sp. NBC_01142]|uniref:hypothetical protein n=1 Tax=Streptomyces sp. NBC_01142 TaxID=2975865 RepID=UPI00224F25CF|nr:hypothetical protein [Streptomyces sp. NBC_01142]MCX4826659.1 hypothetical protein [Streptomyces sp. NBC_01142]